MESFFFALLLTLLAGLSTSIGSCIAFFLKNPSKKFMSTIMGFTAGVMILISFVELLQKGIEATNFLLGHIFFFIGIAIMLVIDVTISHEYEFEQPNLTEKVQNPDSKSKSKEKKTSLLIMLGIFIHNFPEGMVTYLSTLKSVELGIILAFAIALHNIPEGIAVAIPVYNATKSRKKAFLWSNLSGISEPLGALVVGLILYPFMNDFLLGAMLAIVGGFMIYISLDELIPTSKALNSEHYPILGLLIGMTIMAVSLSFL